MSDLRPFLALFVLLVFSLFFIERGIKSALAPFCAVASVGLWVAYFGMFGFLSIGVWLLYGLFVVALAYLLFCYVIKKKPLPSLDFGFWAFALGSFIMLLVLLVREPMFHTWDEFSSWGTCAKLMKVNNELYTTAQVGWAWTATQPPLLASLGYFVQFIGPEFVEWQQYAAINLLQISAIAALLTPLEKKHWPLVAPLALVGFLTPYLFTLYAQASMLTAPWMDSLADVPMGFVFGGILAGWFGQKQPGLKRLVPSFLGLMALALIKDTALALGLVAAVLIAVDMLSQKRSVSMRLSLHIGKAAAVLLGLFFAVLFPFFLWSQHLAFAVNIDRFELGGVRNAGMSEIFILFFKELFSGQQSEHFKLIVEGMPQKFLYENVSMIGPGSLVVAFILALVALAAFLTNDAGQKRRCFVFGIFSSLGFLPYFLLIMVTYLYVFRPEQAFASFGRYMYPYYIGWFLAAVGLLAYAAVHTNRKKLSCLLVMGFSLLLALRVYMLVPFSMSIVGVNAAEFEENRRFESQVQTLTNQLDPNGKTFIISVNDIGLRWFMYCYSFLPWQVDYSYGGGAFEERDLQEDGTTLVTHIDAEGFRRHLAENEVTNVFIDDANEAFAQEYGSVFSDGMQAYFDGETQVYEVGYEDGTLVLNPTDILL